MTTPNIPPRYEPQYCQCEPVCEECGFPVSCHPVHVWAGGWWIDCTESVNPKLPYTGYAETRPATRWEPAEGEDVCQECGLPRE